jgi:hypothetical protein
MSNARLPKFVEIYSAADPIEAHMLCNLLEENGIDARVVGDALSGLGGAVPFGSTTSPRIWIDHASAPRARELIDGWEFERRGGRPARANQPLQFSLKTMFIVTTVCAVACALYGILHDQPWLGLALAAAWYGLQAVLLVAAYIRKRQSQSSSTAEIDASEC